MKFTDLIEEDEQSEFNKVYKRTMTIFKAYRKGRIRTKSGIVFSYELPEEDSHISVSSGQGTDPTGFIMSERIKIKEESERCAGISYGRFGDLIKKRFSGHDVHFAFNVYPEDIENYNGETINEEIIPLTPKDRKKANLIYNMYKKGKFKFYDDPDSITYHYELPDSWRLTSNHDGTLHILCTEPLELYVWIDLTSGPYKKPVDRMHNYLYRDGKRKIMDKFDRHNIFLYIE